MNVQINKKLTKHLIKKMIIKFNINIIYFNKGKNNIIFKKNIIKEIN